MTFLRGCLWLQKDLPTFLTYASALNTELQTEPVL